MKNDPRALAWANAALLPSLMLRLYELKVISHEDSVEIVDRALLQLETLQAKVGFANYEDFEIAREILKNMIGEMGV